MARSGVRPASPCERRQQVTAIVRLSPPTHRLVETVGSDRADERRRSADAPTSTEEEGTGTRRGARRNGLCNQFDHEALSVMAPESVK